MKDARIADVSRAHSLDAVLTLVELTWQSRRIENRIRFGRQAGQQILDRHRRVVSFTSGSVFCFVRWAANDYGTILSRADIMRAVSAGEAYQNCRSSAPGSESAANGGLAQGRAGAPDDRRCGNARHRSDRRRARLLAARSQPPIRQRDATRVHLHASPSLAAATRDWLMTRLAATLATVLSSSTLGTSAFVDLPKTVIWNASASAPIGLYSLQAAGSIDVTDLVAIVPPPPTAQFMAARVSPIGVPR